MHLLRQCSKKTICLTGTLAGGYASDLFYLLYRLMPNRMKEKGFEYDDVLEFAKKYGTVEYNYKQGEDREEYHNSSSRGSSRKAPKVKPGISGLIYTDFLFDVTVFLSMSDLSSFLPEYKESVVSVEMNKDIREQYDYVKSKIMDYINRDKELGYRVYPTLLQTLLAYPDKPYGFDNIINPRGELLVDMQGDQELPLSVLTPKEEKLIELVNEQLERGRNCFIYLEYTGDSDKFVASRVKKVIEHYCGLENEVAFLKSSSPSAEKREKWIHMQASKGIKVFITNPKCVETGLDFVFEYEGLAYNYPTLIFYQLGTNLFTLWQASKRSYRLSQTIDCETYYLAYEDSLQAEIVTLMGKKKMATSTLQGKFSSDGLCTNSGIDVTQQLIGSLKGTVKSSNLATIDNMFKRAAASKVEYTKDELEFIEMMKAVDESKDDIVTKNEEDSIFIDLFASFTKNFASNESEVVVSKTLDLKSNPNKRQEKKVTSTRLSRKSKKQTAEKQIKLF